MSDNVLHWRQNLNPSEKILGLGSKRDSSILQKGDLVILDADFIYEENDPNIKYSNATPLYQQFEKRYRHEKIKLREQEESLKLKKEDEKNLNIYNLDEDKKIHR